MADLLLGPLLRWVGETDATVWVETDAPCAVEVLGCRARTFTVNGHHYAVVVVDGLEPGTVNEYTVELDGEERWPLASSPFPPSSIRTIDPSRRLRMRFGSCRVAAPHDPPYCLSLDDDDRGREVDALFALAHQLRDTPRGDWPDLLLMLGDQVYAEEDAPQTRAFIRERRSIDEPPHDGVTDFEEYTRLYWESWGDETLRWLLSTIGTAMLFDDHDVHDDWNTSEAWVREAEAQPWWHERICSALESYWLYQHLGNLSPAELAEDELLAKLQGMADGEDGDRIMREHAEHWDHHRDGSRWSHARQLGRTKLVFLDSREGRTLEEGKRAMFDEVEWEWLCGEVSGDFDHLVLADTLPMLMPPALHWLEGWNEAVCAGAWGRIGAWALGERVRRGIDLEHWPAFRRGLERLCGLIVEVASGARGEAPATIVLLGGDIHHAYLAEVGLPRGAGAQSAVYQAVCSPFRNPLDSRERAVARFAASRAAIPIGRALGKLAGVPEPPLRWRLVQSPTFDNQVGTLEFDGREGFVRIEKTISGSWPEPTTETTLERTLGGGRANGSAG